MKKSYVKPELFYESFVLSQSIAACGIDVNSVNPQTCQPTTDSEYWYEVTNVFDSAKGTCVLNVDEGDIEAYCYTYGTTEAGRLFNS